MLLYRIRNRETGKFFSGIRWYDGQISWTESGAFYRTPDTIVRHLEYLCGEMIVRAKDGYPRHTNYILPIKRGKLRAIKSQFENRVVKFKVYKKYYALYSVVIDDVKLKGSRRVRVEDFMKRNK
jgi:hypothetical protein